MMSARLVGITLPAEGLPVRIAFAISVVTMALAGIFLLLTVLTRASTILRERRRRRVLGIWTPIMLESLVGRSDQIPAVRLRRREARLVIGAWVSLHETVRGDATERLRAVARIAGFDAPTRRMLASRNASDRLLAIAAAGHLRDPTLRDSLAALLHDRSPVVAGTAARALVRVDAERGLELVAPMLMFWGGWHPARIGAILAEADPARAAGAVADVLATAPPDAVPRLIRYLEAARTPAVLPRVREILAGTDDPEAIAAALHLFGELRDPADAETARRYLHHGSWFVRVQAATALGKLGSRLDELALVRLLADPEWWVRYRAAQALASLPFVTPARLRQMRALHPDRYARDAISQVLAEREIA